MIRLGLAADVTCCLWQGGGVCVFACLCADSEVDCRAARNILVTGRWTEYILCSWID
jgi:hypothetical protein